MLDWGDSEGKAVICRRARLTMKKQSHPASVALRSFVLRSVLRGADQAVLDMCLSTWIGFVDSVSTGGQAVGGDSDDGRSREVA